MKNLFLIAGEPSGDTHGAALARELIRLEPALTLTGLGGPRMAGAGVHLLHDPTARAIVGVAGIFDNLGGLIRAHRSAIHQLSTHPPDALVLIDFPDFNLQVARHARRIGVPVIYYVSPQVWAWRPGRVRTIAQRVRKMLVLFEFEKEFYERAGVDVTWVGHPLLDTMADKLALTDRAAVRRSLDLPESGTIIGLLPGSRPKEIHHVFPVLLRSAQLIQNELKDLTFVTAQAEWLPADLFRNVASRHRLPFHLIAGRTYDVMFASDLLLACSGTATLEAGLLGTPLIATYKSDLLSALLLGPFIRPGHYCLVNIVAGEPIVPELYMFHAQPPRIAAAALELLRGGLDPMRSKLAGFRSKLGQPGASARAAAEVLKLV